MKTGTTQRGGREFDELAPYLKAVRDYPPLSREEEHTAAVRARKGDVAAKQKLVRHNLAFVVAISRKQRRGTVRPQSGTVAQPDMSLDSSVDEEGETTHLERIEDDGPGPEDIYLQTEGDRDVREALGKVRKRIGELGWDIVHNRLEQDQPRTLEEIGKRWGVSRERVRQVELKTKQFLERYLTPEERDAA